MFQNHSSGNTVHNLCISLSDEHINVYIIIDFDFVTCSTIYNLVYYSKFQLPTAFPI